MKNLFLGIGLAVVLFSTSAFLTYGTSTVSNFVNAIGFGTVFISTGQALLNGNGITTVAHGLGAVPVWTHAYVRCVTAELGYSINDRVYISTDPGSSAGLVFSDATNVSYIQTGTINVITKNTYVNSTVTPGNWLLVIEAWK